jgi:molecular chaperone GrpE
MSVQSKKGDSMATITVVRQMLAMLDNYDRAFAANTPETDDEKSIMEEYKLVYADIMSRFEKLGVTEVATVGKEFDYEFHQAVMQRPSDEYESGIVCEEYGKGFVLDTILIRAAMVAVAA